MTHTMTPAEIESRSMEIITEELGGRFFPPENEAVVKRVIHATADFDYADTLYFSPRAAELGRAAIREGACIVTDTRMAWSGINKKMLGRFGGESFCFIDDDSVASEAQMRGITRSAVSMERAAELRRPLIFAIGNAPTALIRLCELMDQGKVSPKLVIGVPVGFVNVVEAKEELQRRNDVPFIVSRGRKGGSTVAAAICNAILYTSEEKRQQR